MEFTEVLVWIVTAFFSFYFFNVIFGLRTAASIFLSLAIATIIIFVLFGTIFSETALVFFIGVGLIYAFFKAIRDKRDDKDFN